MTLWNRATLVGFSFVVALAACADPDRISAPDIGSAEVRALGGESSALSEREALEKIGRLVAVSLGEKALRHQLKKHMRSAPFKEHKLELRTYLRSSDGEQLLKKITGGKQADAILTLLEQVRPLELYMPVRKQRETWVGDAELLVAVQLEEEDAIVGFDSRGTRRQLDPLAPPEQPTLSIVPVETRFDQPMSLGAKNVNDMNGQSIGTLMPATYTPSKVICADCLAEDAGGGGSVVGGGGGIVPPGLYLEFSRILDAKEPWLKGEPEVEVHIHGPTDQANPTIGRDLSCSGERAFDYRKNFNQDDGFWTGRVMLFSADETAAYISQFTEGFHILFWEDDDTSCVIKLDNQALTAFIRSTALAFGTVAVKVFKPGTPVWVMAGAFVAALFENAGAWLKSNDDFIGAAVPISATSYNYPENNHVIMQGTTLNGRATIVYR